MGGVRTTVELDHEYAAKASRCSSPLLAESSVNATSSFGLTPSDQTTTSNPRLTNPVQSLRPALLCLSAACITHRTIEVHIINRTMMSIVPERGGTSALCLDRRMLILLYPTVIGP